MTDPVVDLDQLPEVVRVVSEEARGYLEGLTAAPLRSANADQIAESFAEPIPEDGKGSGEALQTLLTEGVAAHVRSGGPRFFHFVIGGVTPAAFGADWITTLLDQNPGLWVASPLGAQLETIGLEWLKDLFDLPPQWGGTLTTGGTMANYVSLAAARRWWGLEHGKDIDEEGFSSLPSVPVFSSGYIHASAVKVLGMLGIGRSRVRSFSSDATGRLDLDALEAALKELKGAASIIVANAGEVNAGDFDPIERMVDLAEKYGAWIHVDGAFGLFARITPRTKQLTAGVERAQSVSADGHKWLNVPYDCGFAFVHDRDLLRGLFASTASYLTGLDDPRPNLGFISPEASQRARGLTVWATLRAYGRNGYREMVERHLDLAQRVADRVDEAPDLERMADVPLNIVCFRFHPEGLDEDELDAVNRRISEEILTDGRVYVGRTLYAGRVAFRPAIVNWRTTEQDVDLLVDVVREIGNRLIQT
ncbi:MAG: aminotransferase class I/II-fold pyridoxal phosphate-dependent enzyme [Actinomycetota bacterium]|nr:aminotransferase class I/II-fold pyridoxal phosphate-dependent enzyme [Actinomycetota bacterium]